MGLLSGVADFLGLTPDIDPALSQLQFQPFNVQTSAGGVQFDPTQRLFTTELAPELQALRQQTLSGLGQINPAQTLGLLRQQAQPIEQQQRLNLESRLFSQGRLGASSAFTDTGEMGALLRAQQGADVQRQLLAEQLGMQQRQNLFGQLGTLTDIEQSLFAPSLQAGAQESAVGQARANILAGQAQSTSNLIGNLLSGAAIGFATGGLGGAAIGAGVGAIA